jgi:hypothetical protein
MRGRAAQDQRPFGGDQGVDRLVSADGRRLGNRLDI